jgi:hypothetical protein
MFEGRKLPAGATGQPPPGRRLNCRARGRLLPPGTGRERPRPPGNDE